MTRSPSASFLLPLVLTAAFSGAARADAVPLPPTSGTAFQEIKPFSHWRLVGKNAALDLRRATGDNGNGVWLGDVFVSCPGLSAPLRGKNDEGGGGPSSNRSAHRLLNIAWDIAGTFDTREYARAQIAEGLEVATRQLCEGAEASVQAP